MRAVGTAERGGRRQVGKDGRNVVRAAQKPHVVVPLVVGGEGFDAASDFVLGQVLVMGRPGWVYRPVRLEVAAGPIRHVFARLAGRDFDGVVDANEAHAFFHEGVELVQVFHQRMALSAVGKHDHAGRVVEDVRIFGQPFTTTACTCGTFSLRSPANSRQPAWCSCCP